jgi:hypothetical protein
VTSYLTGYSKGIPKKKGMAMPLTKTVRIKTDAIRRIDNPTDKNLYELVGPLYAQSVAEVEIPLDPNPREQKSDAAAYQGMRDNLREDNHIFEYAANGMLMFASNGHYDNENKEIVLEFKANSGDGLANGGHLYQAIQTANKTGEIPTNKKVFARVIVGLDNESKVKIVEGASTTISVARYSILNLNGSFDWIKKQLENTPYEGKVQYFQNDKGVINVLDLLCLMYAIMRTDKDDLKTVGRFYPRHAYSAKSVVVKEFDSKKGVKRFKEVENEISEVLRFRDHVQANAYDMCVKLFDNIVPESKWKKMFVSNNGTNFLYAKDQPKYKLAHGLLVPIIAGTRSLAKQNKNQYSADLAIEAWDNIGEEVISFMWDLAKGDDTQLRGIVYNPVMWNTTYDKFDSYEKIPF